MNPFPKLNNLESWGKRKTPEISIEDNPQIIKGVEFPSSIELEKLREDDPKKYNELIDYMVKLQEPDYEAISEKSTKELDSYGDTRKEDRDERRKSYMSGQWD